MDPCKHPDGGVTTRADRRVLVYADAWAQECGTAIGADGGQPAQPPLAAEAKAPLPTPITPADVLKASFGFKRRAATAHGMRRRHLA